MTMNKIRLKILVVIVIFGGMFSFTSSIYAHCDTLEGPVVKAAKESLVTGEITPLLKWVTANDEQVIRSAFKKTLEVRKLGNEAQNLADMYFFETLVRIHRAGEGMPYAGLKPGTAVDPAVALADKALESGTVDKLVETLTNAMAKGLRERFNRALDAKKHADENVVTGRKFVESYVTFTHFVEGLHTIIKDASAHHDH